MAKTVVGVFDRFLPAEDAIQELGRAGFARNDISMVAAEEAGRARKTVETGPDMVAGAGAGAAIGGVAGLILGLAALVPGIGPIVAASTPRRQITARSIQIIETISRYRLLPTSFSRRLIPGFTTAEHLRMLFDRGVINRFAFPRLPASSFTTWIIPKRSTFCTCPATPSTLNGKRSSQQQREAYCEINDPSKSSETQGRLLFLAHELMISRFHFMLEMAARYSFGEVELATFKQGAQLWNRIEVRIRQFNGFTKRWEKGDPESFPHVRIHSSPCAFRNAPIASRQPTRRIPKAQSKFLVYRFRVLHPPG